MEDLINTIINLQNVLSSVFFINIDLEGAITSGIYYCSRPKVMIHSLNMLSPRKLRLATIAKQE